MTIEALYKKIIASDELKSAFAEAVKAQKLDEFLKSQGCEATGAEIVDFLKSLQKAEGELADDELNSVAGGCDAEEAIYSLSVAICIAIAVVSAANPKSENKDDWGDKMLCDQ